MTEDVNKLAAGVEKCEKVLQSLARENDDFDKQVAKANAAIHEDVMDRSTPRVPPHRYSVNFVPAVNKTNSDVKSLLVYDPRYLYI